MKKLLLTLLLIPIVGIVCYAQTPSFASPAFYSISQVPTDMVQADFTGDGKPDLAIVSPSSVPAKVFIYRNTGAGAFVLHFTYTAPAGSTNVPQDIVAGDFDGDNDQDIAGVTPGYILAMTNSGTGTFTGETVWQLTGSNMSVATGYFNADNRPDLAITYPNGNAETKLRVFVSISTSAVQFGQVQYLAVGNLPNDVGTADFNNDGITDIAVGNSSSSNISILKGDGTGYFFPAVNYSFGTSLNKLTIADFNNDNYPDVALTRSGFSDGRLLLNNGSGGLNAPTVLPSPTGGNTPTLVLNANVNGDDNKDLILKVGNDIAVYPGNGNGTFGALSSFGAGATGSETLDRIITGDFNGDGKTDIVGTLSSATTGRIAVLLNNATYSPEPTVAASGITFTNVTSSTVRVGWTSGNGAGRLVVAREGSPVNQAPADLTAYTANASFPSGQEIGTGNRVVYAGTGNFVDVTGLTSGSTYHFAVYEYNGAGTSINYKTTGAPTGSVTMIPGVFVIDPANNTTAKSITLTINGMQGASSYTVELNTNATFTGTSVVKTTTTLTTNFPEIVPSTTYYVRVKTNLSALWGPTTSFVAGPPQAFAYLTTPVNGGIAISNALTSNVVPGATSYTIEINTSSTFAPASAIVKTGGRTISFSELVFGTLYYVRVRTNLSATWGPTQTFTTGTVETFTYVTSPANGSTTSQYNVTANSVAGATSYTIEVNTSPTFASTGIVKTNSTRTMSFSELLYGQVYYTRVKTNISPNWGPTKSFTTGTADAFSYLVTPSNGATGVAVDVQLIPNIINGATTYEIMLSDNIEFNPFTDLLQGSGSPYSPTVYLNYATLYYVRVRTNLSATWGPTRSFTTVEDPGGFALAQEDTTDKVFPNQFADRISFVVKDSRAQGAVAYILDSQGMLVYQSAAHSTSNVNEIGGLENLPGGIYYLRVTYGKETKSFKLVKR